MAVPQTFRSAFNGFHREDVVRYLEYINTKHTNQINQLTTEADMLRSELEALRSEPVADPLQQETVTALELERDDLLTQLEEMTARCSQLEQQLAQAQAAAAVTREQESLGRAEELEAYRRAERAERLARERAEQLYHQTNGVLADATAKVDGVAAEVSTIADQVMMQLGQLQTAVSSSKRALQDAAATMYTLRPNPRDL